jgi:formiminotetrahydrofolate cyclodeaminase
MSYQEEQLSQEEREKRVYNLTVELKDTEVKKKATTKAYNEEIKRLKSELKDLISKDLNTFDVI